MAAPTRGHGSTAARTFERWGDRLEDAGDRVQEPLREHAETIQRVGRVGWVAKGFVYAALALLVWQLARQGAPAESADQQGALRELAGSSGGTWLLGLVAVGLALYAMWRLSEAAMATSEGAVDRLGALGSGLLHLALAVLAIRLVLDGEASGEGGGTSTDDRAAGLLGSTGGRLLVGAIGVVLIGMAVEQVRRAWTASFMRKIDSTDFRRERSAIEVLGRAGHAARGVVWAIVGGFLAVAAWQVDRDDAKGLDGSLREVAQHGWGDVLLAVTAIGLAMYALFCVVSARHQVLRRH